MEDCIYLLRADKCSADLDFVTSTLPLISDLQRILQLRQLCPEVNAVMSLKDNYLHTSVFHRVHRPLRLHRQDLQQEAEAETGER